jgi:plastocyanin
MKIRYLIGIIAVCLLLAMSGCKNAGEVVNTPTGNVAQENSTAAQEDANEAGTETTDVKELIKELSEEAGLPTETEETEDAETVTGSEAKIVIDNFQGTPEDLTIKVGTTVTIVNEQENFKHNVGIWKKIEGNYVKTALDGYHILLPGDSYSYKFNETGDYKWLSKSNYPDTSGEIKVTE